MFDRESVKLIFELLNVCLKAVVVTFVVQYMEERRKVQSGEKERNQKEFAVLLVLVITLLGLINSVVIFMTSAFGFSSKDIILASEAGVKAGIQAAKSEFHHVHSSAKPTSHSTGRSNATLRFTEPFGHESGDFADLH